MRLVLDQRCADGAIVADDEGSEMKLIERDRKSERRIANDSARGATSEGTERDMLARLNLCYDL